MAFDDVRVVTVQVMQRLLSGGGSLTKLLPDAQLRVAENERALLQAFCFGMARWSLRLSWHVDMLMQKPLKAKDTDVYLLMQLGIFQLAYSRVPEHAAVNTTVSAVKKLGKPWSRALVNGVLRNYQRRAKELNGRLDDDIVHAHPIWLMALYKEHWPEQWQAIAIAANEQAPMSLRVNTLHQQSNAYLERLAAVDMQAITSPYAIPSLTLVEPAAVHKLPGFADGDVSVQDSAAQLAASLLPGSNSERLLDACSAPGGKTAHALEAHEWQQVVALDQDATRLQRVEDTLIRLGLQDRATLVAADAADTDSWWDGNLFDAILLDAPCTGTGVIRRHPDIKLLRRVDDVDKLRIAQLSLLQALWQVLKPGGRLLYATCSILKTENEWQVEQFINANDNAVHVPIQADWGHQRDYGRQILTGENGMDGFYYALIEKRR